VKWFPDRRGLAVGLTAGGFGAGAALTVIPISLMINGLGYASTFFWFGLGQGIVLMLIAPVLRGPVAGEMPATAAPKVQQTAHNPTPGEVLRSPLFWLLYLMLTAVAASGLIVTAQIAPIANDFGLAKTILIFGAPVLAVALVVDNVMNGLARPFFGWVSDN